MILEWLCQFPWSYQSKTTGFSRYHWLNLHFGYILTYLDLALIPQSSPSTIELEPPWPQSTSWCCSWMVISVGPGAFECEYNMEPSVMVSRRIHNDGLWLPLVTYVTLIHDIIIIKIIIIIMDNHDTIENMTMNHDRNHDGTMMNKEWICSDNHRWCDGWMFSFDDGYSNWITINYRDAWW